MSTNDDKPKGVKILGVMMAIECSMCKGQKTLEDLGRQVLCPNCHGIGYTTYAITLDALADMLRGTGRL